MFWIALFIAICVWSDADHDILEPPWQWARIIVIALCVVVMLVAHVVSWAEDRDRRRG